VAGKKEYDCLICGAGVELERREKKKTRFFI